MTLATGLRRPNASPFILSVSRYAWTCARQKSGEGTRTWPYSNTRASDICARSRVAPWHLCMLIAHASLSGTCRRDCVIWPRSHQRARMIILIKRQHPDIT
jgi:hypothetical protein